VESKVLALVRERFLWHFPYLERIPRRGAKGSCRTPRTPGGTSPAAHVQSARGAGAGPAGCVGAWSGPRWSRCGGAAPSWHLANRSRRRAGINQADRDAELASNHLRALGLLVLAHVHLPWSTCHYEPGESTLLYSLSYKSSYNSPFK
jgi:hypothetical protein